jgi:CheY-like chemotaxis protein
MPDKTALIVDDEVAIRLFIKAVLQQHGFVTIQAADGIEALHLLRSAAAGVDLLLSDIRMPNMDGITLARAIRAEFRPISIILMSGYCSRDEARDLDVHFIPKPFTPATLLAAIESVMAQKKEPSSEIERHDPTLSKTASG